MNLNQLKYISNGWSFENKYTLSVRKLYSAIDYT